MERLQCLLLLLFVSLLCSLVKAQSCEEITVPICQGIGYNHTSFPNLLNHAAQDEAGLEIQQFLPLLQVQCSENIQRFLCSIYFPICLEPHVSKVPPCQSLCEEARDGCSPLMEQYGFPWPSVLNCNKFATADDNEPCIDIYTSNENITSPATMTSSQSLLPVNEEEGHMTTTEMTTSRQPAVPTVVSPSNPRRRTTKPIRRMEFEARYRIDCAEVLRNPEWKDLVESAAKKGTIHLQEICAQDCVVRKKPTILCRKNKMIIRWPTDNEYSLSVGKISSTLKKTLRERMKCKKTMLMTVIMDGKTTPTVKFPVSNKAGSSARLVMTTFCPRNRELVNSRTCI